MSTNKSTNHSGANLWLKRSYPKIRIMGGSEDAIPGMNEPMYEKTEFSMFDGKLKGNCLTHRPKDL